MAMIRPLHLKDAWLDGRPGDLYMTRIVLGNAPLDAFPVSLDGYSILPGLINAHDHLAHNHYPRSKFQAVYGNAHQWGEDLGSRLGESPYREGRAMPVAERLFLGKLKNLFCGATTVAHHDRLYEVLRQEAGPVHVLLRYGWAHSLHFEKCVAATHAQTPEDAPWFIHLAEGTDEVAVGEYARLEALGCAQPNTVLVHGVGLTPANIRHAAPRVRGLVWCPSSNQFLFGRTAPVRAWTAAGGRVALGSDSRLTGDGDLLDELRAALAAGQVDMPEIRQMVTTGAARLLGLPDSGHLRPGARADWIALPFCTDAYATLTRCRRADLALVVCGGVPMLGDPELMARFPDADVVPATLDGKPKFLDARLAERIRRCPLREPGLELQPAPAGA
jgi:cytosine/adenosine deaminase-related metal-dependent hydrolase